MIIHNVSATARDCGWMPFWGGFGLSTKNAFKRLDIHLCETAGPPSEDTVGEILGVLQPILASMADV